MFNVSLKAFEISTPLGLMIAIADENALYLLEFADNEKLDRKVERLRIKTKSALLPGSTYPIVSIEKELALYFKGELYSFKTPIHLIGSSFQKAAWIELMKIPYGTTRSYLEQASSINNAKAYRSVANANGANQLAIIIPCHRIINNNGNLGGYGWGVHRKKWLIEHEKHFKDISQH